MASGSDQPLANQEAEGSGHRSDNLTLPPTHRKSAPHGRGHESQSGLQRTTSLLLTVSISSLVLPWFVQDRCRSLRLLYRFYFYHGHLSHQNSHRGWTKLSKRQKSGCSERRCLCLGSTQLHTHTRTRAHTHGLRKEGRAACMVHPRPVPVTRRCTGLAVSERPHHTLPEETAPVSDSVSEVGRSTFELHVQVKVFLYGASTTCG